MKYTIYEDPRTHAFALLALPNRFVEGDQFPIIEVDRWFGSRDEAIAALPDLFNREEPDPATEPDIMRVLTTLTHVTTTWRDFA